jgi:hypothetical protein
MTAPLDHFLTLNEALREGRPRPDRQTAAFTAVGLVHGEGSVTERVERTRAAHEALLAARGRMRAPTGAMRWIHAAMLASRNVDPARYVALVEALREQEKTAKAGGLYAGGTRAALVLSMADDVPADVVGRFFDLKRGLKPPWWRSNSAITDTFAAAHALTGGVAAQVAAARERAIAVFATDKRARAYKRDGARVTVLHGDAPEAVLARFNALEDARRSDRFLRGRTTRGLAMEWAAGGLTPHDFPALVETMQALPRGLESAGYARARLAHMINFGTENGHPAESAAAMAAVLAAQAAMIAAIVASTSAATTSVATS